MPESIVEKIIHYLTTPLEEKIRKWLTKVGIIPKYTEITIYLISITFILLVIANVEFREEFLGSFFKEKTPEGIVLAVITLIILALSIYNVFKDRIITKIEKDLILYFVILVNAFTGIFAGFYVLEKTQGWLIIPPLINIINTALLCILYRIDVITEKSISDVQAKKEEIILGTIFVIIILLISQYVFNNYWAITFSICLVYATSLVDLSDKIIIKNLLKRDKENAE